MQTTLSFNPNTQTLNDIQSKAVNHHQGPQLILAGAGSGKTRVLTFKIAALIGQQGVPPSNIMAVTFTNKAAREMLGRVEKLLETKLSLPWMGTFHSVCVRILRAHATYLGYQSNFSIFDRDDQKRFVKKLLKERGEETLTPEKLIWRVSYFKNRHISPDEAAKEAVYQDDEQLAQYYSFYQNGLKKNNAMDFDDLIEQTIVLMEQFKEVREKFQRRLHYILIDEFQDTNKSQFRLIKLMLGEHCNITVVGDEDQSIYGWRGADINNILDFQKSYQNVNVVKMEQNYRSTGNILGVAASVIKNNKQRLGKTVWTDNSAGSKVVLKTVEDETDEAKAVIKAIQKKGNDKLGETAIFYRTNAQSRVFEDELRRKQIPYMIFGGIRFYDRMEIKDILAYLKVLVNPSDSVSLGRIINVPKRGIGLKTVEKFADYAIDKEISLFDAMLEVCSQQPNTPTSKKIAPFLKIIQQLQELVSSKLPISQIIESVIEDSGYRRNLQESNNEGDEDRLQNVEELITAGEDFDGLHPDATLELFLQETALYTQEDEVSAKLSAVTLMTVHSSKGLEFPYVYLTGLEDGLFPLVRDGNEDDIEEERRLFYVAVTRARKDLTLLHANQRRIWGNFMAGAPSRFIREIDKRYLDWKKKTESRSDFLQTSKGRHYEPVDQDFTPSDDCQLPSDELAVGTSVMHHLFGKGRIQKIEGRGASARITVFFGDGITRKLIAKFAKLSILG